MKKGLRIFLAVLLCMATMLMVACKDEKDPQKSDPTKKPAANPGVTASADPSAGGSTALPTPGGDAVYPSGSKMYAGSIKEGELKWGSNNKANYPKDADTNWDFYDFKHYTAVEFDEGSVAVRFFATTSFNSVYFTVPTWGQANGYSSTVSLYKWDTAINDYDEIIAGTPIATETHMNSGDGGDVGVTLGKALPDGEYLLRMTTTSRGATHNIGIWSCTYPDHGLTETWINDIEAFYEIPMFFINYTETPEVKFGPLNEW